MSKTGWILVAIVIGIILFSGGVMIVNREQMASLLRAAFARYGLPEDWGEALGETETRLNPNAVNLTGGDLKLGGSYGVTQITADLLNLTGGPSPDVLRGSPELQAEWTARLVAQGAAIRFKHGIPTLVTFGRPSSPEQMASVWNGGRLPDDPNLPDSTRDVYIPRLLDYLPEA